METGKVVHPQPDRLSQFGRQLTCKTPAHANVAEIIDDRAENVPSARHGKSQLQLALQVRRRERIRDAGINCTQCFMNLLIRMGAGFLGQFPPAHQFFLQKARKRIGGLDGHRFDADSGKALLHVR